MPKKRVLVFSARMGAGHEGASREIARRLGERGLEVRVVDFLDAFPRPLAWAWERFYRFQLQYMPESYESTYQWFYRFPELWKPFVAFERLLSGRRALRWVREIDPDLVVSTYSFATLVLGSLRSEGLIRAPVVNYLTDFGVHPRAVHPGVDVNCALHPEPARKAATLTTSPVVVGGAAVAPAFLEPRDRVAARRDHGLDSEVAVALVVSGSWGIGNGLVETVERIASSGRYHVVTVCGTDRKLKRALEARGLGTTIGWEDDMRGLMAAADVLVENAGGLTSLEAFAAGLPVVSFRPIPGHGRENVVAMDAAGAATFVRDDESLLGVLDELSAPGSRRTSQVAQARALFDVDPTDGMVALLDATR